MANGNPNPKNKRASLTKKHVVINDDNTSLSPLYDIFEHQLQYSMHSNSPSSPNDYCPLPYNPHQPVGFFEYPLSYIQDNDRKRQRRQTPGNVLIQTLFNRGNNSAAAAPMGNGNYPVSGPGGASAAQNAIKAAKKKQSTAQPRPKIAIPPGGIGPILDPNINDVLSGRGGRINAHVGNVQFREIVAEQKKIYLAKDTKKLEKAHIAADIVYFIRRMDPPGRFLKEDVNGAWWDIGDQKAIKKVGQALREDAPEIRDPDDIDGIYEQQQQHDDIVTPIQKTLAQVPSVSMNELTPIQENRTIHISPESPAISLPIPAVTTSGGSNVMMGNKSAIVVSGRGGKLTHSNSSSSIRANQGRGGVQQHPVSVRVDIRPPDAYQSIIPAPPPQRVGQGKTPFYSNLGFGGGTVQRIGATVSGAAASVMKQQQQLRPMHEFEVPAARNSAQDVAFGRTFHPPPENQHGESSLISGLSGGACASEISGISALTDPMSSVSNSDGFNHGQSRAIRQAQLDRIRSNWAAPNAISSSDNTPTVQLLNASNGIGSSLNNSNDMNQDQLDDCMSWTHSLHGGGIGSIVGKTARDDSALVDGTESIGSGANFSLGGLSATSGGGLMGESKYATLSGPIRSERMAKNSAGGLAAYYQGDAASVTSGMSIASTDAYSMSELSENLVALDLSHNVLGPLHENEI